MYCATDSNDFPTATVNDDGSFIYRGNYWSPEQRIEYAGALAYSGGNEVNYAYIIFYIAALDVGVLRNFEVYWGNRYHALEGGHGTGFFSPQLESVPLPATLPLFASGIAIMGWVAYRRRRLISSEPSPPPIAAASADAARSRGN